MLGFSKLAASLYLYAAAAGLIRLHRDMMCFFHVAEQ